MNVTRGAARRSSTRRVAAASFGALAILALAGSSAVAHVGSWNGVPHQAVVDSDWLTALEDEADGLEQEHGQGDGSGLDELATQNQDEQADNDEQGENDEADNDTDDQGEQADQGDQGQDEQADSGGSGSDESDGSSSDGEDSGGD